MPVLPIFKNLLLLGRQIPRMGYEQIILFRQQRSISIYLSFPEQPAVAADSVKNVVGD